MMRWHILRLILLIALLTFLSSSVTADDNTGRTTVAVAATLPGSAPDVQQQQQQQVAGFLELLDVMLSEDPGLQVVERRQLDRIAAELALSVQSDRSAPNRLDIGRITTADRLVLSWIERETSSGDRPQPAVPRLMVRVLDVRTGQIQGTTTAMLNEFDPAEAARQVARDVRDIIARPARPVQTVAVLPFDSEGRFDRLRPFETTIRDLISARLLDWVDPAEGEAKAPRLRVLQRSNLNDLLKELELVQSGFAEAASQSAELPIRAATLMIRGRINEKSGSDHFIIQVTGEVLDAASAQVVHRFDLEATPPDLPVRLRRATDLMVRRLSARTAKAPLPPASESVTARNVRHTETEALFEQVRFDLRRFQRVCPVDFSHWRPMAMIPLARELPLIPVESPTGQHLLRKSMDRLESLLFIEPDRAEAMFALAFCRSLPGSDAQDLRRTDELLRRAISAAEPGPLRTNAIRLLSECGFHHQTGQPVPGVEDQTAQQVLDAFRWMPKEQDHPYRSRLPKLISALPLDRLAPDRLIEALMLTASAAESESQDSARYQLAMTSIRLAIDLHRTARREAGQAFLMRWSEGEQPLLSSVARRGLAQWSEQIRQYDRAAEWYLKAAEVWPPAADRALGPSVSMGDNLRIHAGRNLRQAGRIDEALQLLSMLEPHPDSLNRGYHAQELGHCLTAIGDDRRALDLLIRTAERVPSIVDNSDIVQRIQKLGGVPLREDRAIDVRVLSGPGGKVWTGRRMVTDGRVLFCAGGFSGTAARGVHVFDPQTETWSALSQDFGLVTDLALDQGRLWVGTDGEGLWCCNLIDRRWTHWSMTEGLPDNRISTLAVRDGTLFAGTGTPSAGGVIRLTPDRTLSVLDQAGAPATAPTHLVLTGKELLAAGPTILSLDLISQTWSERMPGTQWHVFATPTQVLASTPGRELFPLDAPESPTYRAAWTTAGDFRRHYRIHSVCDWQNALWLSGTPWQQFVSSGLYRLNPETGQFDRFGPRDGFPVESHCETFAAVPLGPRLWLSTSFGLAVVELRQSAAAD